MDGLRGPGSPARCAILRLRVSNRVFSGCGDSSTPPFGREGLSAPFLPFRRSRPRSLRGSASDADEPVHCRQDERRDRPCES